MKNHTLLPLTACLFVSVNVLADSFNPDSFNQVYQQAKTTVTAARYEQLEIDVIPSISVIDREDILNLQANNIMDILSLQQGIDVARNGGNGSATSIFMRGTNSNHALVLIDGMRVSSSFTGSFTWEHLPVSQIERIEIVRGTRVSYYGADAIGGVINIITRKQENTYVRYTTGSFGTHNIDLGYGNVSEDGYYSLVLGSQKTDGYSATNENNFFGFNPDDDGYENLSINLKAGMSFDNGQVGFNYLESKGDVDFDSFFNVGNSDTKERVVRITWTGIILNDWQSEVALGNNKNSLSTKAFSNGFKSERISFDVLANKAFDNQHLGLGITYRKEDADFNNVLINQLNYSNSRNNTAVFANWRGDFKQHVFSASARYDHNSVYGNDTSADLDWAYKFNENIRFNISAGSAFKAPNLNELFAPQFQAIVFSPELEEFINFFSFEGNPDLKPEESINYEVGLKTQISETQRLSLNAFYYKIDNLVDFQGTTFKPVNVNKATIKGLELDYNYRYKTIRLNINATVQDANNDQTNTSLLRRPDNKLNLSADKFFNRFSIGSSIRYASKSPDFGVELEGYTVIDFRAAYTFNNHWKVSAKIENATDKNYQIINGFNTPDLSGYVSIQWQQ